MSVNKVILLGHLGKDPELRMTSSQNAVCNFSLATNERRKDASGNWSDHTEWHTIVCFGKTAENCSKYLKKGKQVFIDGKIQTRKWKDKEDKDRYTTEIVANNVTFVGAKGEASMEESRGMGGGMSSSEEMSGGRSLLDSLPSADSIAGSKGGADPIPFDDDDIPF
jgi:single-strand DNA-binding protein